ncbi:MAG TPA: VOC family protein [Solirubrobacteraceae bacterium]
MLGAVDHVGYLALELDETIAEFTRVFGVQVVRRFERPAIDVIGAYLGEGEGSVEVFTFGERDLTERRLAGAAAALDHVAYAVDDIEAVAASMRHVGVRFSGPDLRGELHEPIELGGVLHLWTLPETSAGQTIQLLQRPAAPQR